MIGVIFRVYAAIVTRRTLHSTMSRALADSWFPATQVNTRPLSVAGADDVRYQLTAVVLQAGRSLLPCSEGGDLSTVSTVRTNLLSTATCRMTARNDRREAPSHALSATATHATPDWRPRLSVTEELPPPTDELLSCDRLTRRHDPPSSRNVATNTSLTATAYDGQPCDVTHDFNIIDLIGTGGLRLLWPGTGASKWACHIYRVHIRILS